jgi:hypothetical protein
VIETKEDAHKFLSELIDKINAQDNRCTAMPYFYVVRRERWRLTERGYGHGKTKSVKYFSHLESEFETYEEYTKRCHEYYDTDFNETKAKEAWDQADWHDMVIEHEDENIFFTEDGYNEHIRLNGHNYRGSLRHYSYVKHAFRNPEIKDLLLSVAILTDKKLSKERQ